MKKIVFTLLVPVVMAAVLFTCSQQNKEADTGAVPLDEAAVAVRLSPVTEGQYHLPVVSHGIISTGTESRLGFKIGGVVAKVNVEEGASVVKGQLLASLNLTEIDAQVAQARNNFEKTQRDWERVQRLYTDSAATLEQWQNAQTAFQLAKESLEAATFNRHYASIRATTSGKVIRKLVNEGELVAPGTPVLVINAAAENDWIVRVGLPDVDWVRVKLGDKVSITTDAHRNKHLDGEVTLIGEGADPMSGLYTVEVKVNPAGTRLASGLVARVEITPSEVQPLKSIPIEALVEGTGNQAFVFVMQPDQKSVKKLPVTIAYLTNQEARIVSGLENVQQVVTGGSAFLTEYATVKVMQ